MSHGGRYYVYAHYDTTGIVYIGKGSTDRAYVATHRHPDHRDFMVSCIEGEVKFVDMIARGLSEKEALSFERGLISQIQPKWNAHFGPLKIKKPKSLGKKRPEHSDFMVAYYRSNPHQSKGKPAPAVVESNRRRKGETRHRSTYTCPHCHLEGKGPNMKRYHFDNCKELQDV